VPQSESGNKTIKTLDDRRIYELIGPAAAVATSITDFEGRTLLRSANTLMITGDSVAHIILRWRFTTPHSVTINGTAANITTDPNGIPTVEFDYTGKATISWQ